MDILVRPASLASARRSLTFRVSVALESHPTAFATCAFKGRPSPYLA